MYRIERRAGRDILYNTLFSQSEFKSFDSYRSEKKEYLTVVEPMLPPGWTSRQGSAYWCSVKPEDDQTPQAGFKIHLSATLVDSEALLRTVVPEFIARGVAFKFVIDRHMHAFVNSQNCGKSSSGKFITVYPRDEAEFQSLAQCLVVLTAGFDGPYILSDRRMEGSRVVFYRYGAFFSEFHLNHYGEKQAMVRLPDGRLASDRRMNFFVLPDGVVDPFQSEEKKAVEPLLKGRYLAESCLSNSNKGGVYVGRDQHTGQKVIIKEVRPHINRSDSHGFDALDLLKNEARCLRALSDTGLVPQVYDEFQDWEHQFLVMEYVSGKELSLIRAEEDFALNLKTGYSLDDLRNFYGDILFIAEKLISALYAIHERGVVVTDLSPQNVLFDRAEGKFRFIDFEGANYTLDESCPNFRIGTMGFTNNDQFAARKPMFSDDFDALCNILYSLIVPANSLFVLVPERKTAIMAHFMSEKGGSAEFLALFSELSTDRARNACLLSAARASLEDMQLPACKAPNLDVAELHRMGEKLSHTLRTHLRLEDGQLACRPDYRALSTSLLHFAHGAGGICFALERLGHGLAPDLRQWLIAQVDQQTSAQLAPGLHNGFAGLAWLLMEMGDFDRAGRCLRDAGCSPLFGRSLDLWYGLAGIGLAALRHYKLTGDAESLRLARECGDRISAKLERDEGRCFFRNDEQEIFHGLCHGNAGLALFFLRLCQVGGDSEHYRTGQELLAFDMNASREQDGYCSWARTQGSRVVSPYLRVGNAGMIHVLLRFYAHGGEARYLDMAERAGRYLFGKFCLSPCYFTGMAGVAEALLELFLATGNTQYRDEAYRFVERIRLFGKETDTELSFAGEDLLRFTDDLATGTAGIALFIKRLSGSEAVGGLYDF
ncbi:MAG: protein kinase/lanthionine synthetase C family protein [Gammaproteobacteria bacterium]|nr:protein kinase/lanthionine synthetase C family protein [Gammaproteobacteria bacterium]